MISPAVKSVFFWFSTVLIAALIFFQIYRREHLVLNQIALESKEAPDFRLQNVSLSDYRGKAVLLHFWATWCPACRTEMPLLVDMAKRLEGKIVLLTIAVDSNPQEVHAFLSPYKPNFPVLIDEKHQVASLYGISSFPESILIGADGKLRALYMGAQDWKQFNKN